MRGEQAHDDDRGVRPLPRLALTDDELLGLANYLERTARRQATREPFPPSAVKVLNAAIDVIHEDRVSRRD